MKHNFFLLLGLSVLSYFNTAYSSNTDENADKAPAPELNGETLHIASTSDLAGLTMTWIREYNRINPSVKFVYRNIPDNQTDKPDGIYFVTEDVLLPAGNEAPWTVRIGQQAVVPVFNADNPMIRSIITQGLSDDEFARLFSGTGSNTWAEVLDGGLNKPVSLYMTDEANVRSCVSGFSKIDQDALKVILKAKPEDLIASIQQDPYSIGFCRLSDMRREGRNELPEKIRLLPVDKNRNGRMDYFESIYNTPDDLSRGVWIGKFPHALSGSIYALSQARPENKNELAFLAWIMTDGVSHLVSNGYSDLISTEKQAALAIIMNNPPNEITTTGSTATGAFTWLIILGIATGTILVLAVFFFIISSLRTEKAVEIITITPAFNESTVNVPQGLFFDKAHTWAFMEEDGTIKMGIDDFMPHITGTITRVIMKEPGEMVRRGEKIVTIIRYGKQLSLYAPVSGTIKSQNDNLNRNSSLINTSPFKDGWIYRIEPKNWLREIQLMLMGENYRNWLRHEFTRLRYFFETSMKSHSTVYDHVILQDGGELRDNVLADMEPEVWEEFQSSFIDSSR
jgi:glycine cleavage system H lipoate-binding protein/ABC-type phosphate transport system substrate-binding protein